MSNKLSVSVILILMWGMFIGCGENEKSSGSWKVAQHVEINDGDALFPNIAIDGSGNAIAVWHQHDGVRNNIWSNYYTVGVGWGVTQMIESDNSGSAGYPKIVIDSSGNAIAVWSQDDGVRSNIWSNRYSPDGGWGTAQKIESVDSGSTSSPQIAIDSSGNAITVWSQHDGTRYDIWSNRYSPDNGWGIAQKIENLDTGSASTPRIAIDRSGHALAVWSQYDGVGQNIWLNRYSLDSGWGTAQKIQNDDTGMASGNPEVAIDSSGNALIVWEQSDDVFSSIWSIRYTVGSGLGTAQMIQSENIGSAYDTEVAIDSNGNALVVWTQEDPQKNVWSNRYTIGVGWGIAQKIEDDDMGLAHNPKIAIDNSGHALVVWFQHDGVFYNIMSNRFE